MSNIYIQEPPTTGKVLLVTTVGDIDIELWCKEAPKACRNFIQLCMEGYYNGIIFHRVVKGFIVQGGDPTGTGEGGESIWGKPFKDEIHSRLRCNRRGLVAMANAGPNDNGSQFFFTLGSAPELNNKHTIFGKVAGNTIYNMIKLEDCEVRDDERPLYPHKILKTKILSSPFDDIIPRMLSTKKDKGEDVQKKRSTAKATKNFNLLSFGEEAEEDEEEVDKATESMRGKSKSSHDLLDDEKLSALPAVHQKRKSEQNDEADEDAKTVNSEAVRKKLKLPDKEKDKKEKELRTESASLPKNTEDTSPIKDKQSLKMEELRRQQESLKREIMKQKQPKETPLQEEKTEADADSIKDDDNDLIASYKAERRKFKEIRKQQKPKGSSRENETLAFLAQFKSTLSTAQKMHEEVENTEKNAEKTDPQEGDHDSDDDMTWLGHKLQFDEKSGKVIDASVDDADRYEIYDPRNPLTKRRRESNKHSTKKK